MAKLFQCPMEICKEKKGKDFGMKSVYALGNLKVFYVGKVHSSWSKKNHLDNGWCSSGRRQWRKLAFCQRLRNGLEWSPQTKILFCLKSQESLFFLLQNLAKEKVEERVGRNELNLWANGPCRMCCLFLLMIITYTWNLFQKINGSVRKILCF